MKKSSAKLVNNHRFRILVSLACLIFVMSLEAQTNVPAPLPPEAQEALKKGIMAAKQQEWEIAIRSFQEARKTAPNAPITGAASAPITSSPIRRISTSSLPGNH
jgi:hypothetical protein